MIIDIVVSVLLLVSGIAALTGALEGLSLLPATHRDGDLARLGPHLEAEALAMLRACADRISVRLGGIPRR